MPDQSPTGSVETDARFLLANERTLLAWVRTALAFLAGGGGVAQFATRFDGRIPLAVALTVAGMSAALVGGLRFRRADAAIRRRQLPATGQSPYVLAGFVAVVGLALLAAVLFTKT